MSWKYRNVNNIINFENFEEKVKFNYLNVNCERIIQDVLKNYTIQYKSDWFVVKINDNIVHEISFSKKYFFFSIIIVEDMELYRIYRNMKRKKIYIFFSFFEKIDNYFFDWL